QPEQKRRFRTTLGLTYDAIGNVVAKDQTNTLEQQTGQGFKPNPVADTTYSLRYTYGGPGPHAPTEVSAPGTKPPKDQDLFFTYDGDGNQLARTPRGDHNPAMSQQWDTEDRLKDARAPNGVHQQMLYDAGGSRTHSETTAKLTLYVNQFLTVSDGHIHSKHIY